MKRTSAVALVLALASAVAGSVACYQSYAETAGDSVDARDDAHVGDAPREDARPNDAGTDAAACMAAIQIVARELPGTYTAVARLDYETLEPLGYQLAGGGYDAVTEEAARDVARGRSWCAADGRMLNPPSPDDEYVFFDPPADLGCVSAVSALGGEPAFNATIVWDGTGDILFPADWRELPLMPPGCDAMGPVGDGRGYDLRTGDPLPAADVRRVLAAVDGTVLPSASWMMGYVFNAVVLLYPPRVGGFDPAVAEWIVLIGAGWLE